MDKINEILCALGFECKTKDEGIFYHKKFTIPFNFSQCIYPLDIVSVIYNAGQNNSDKDNNYEPIIKHFQD